MQYLTESGINMLKYVATMFAFLFAVPMSVHITSIILRTLDRVRQMQYSVDIHDADIANLTERMNRMNHELDEYQSNTRELQQLLLNQQQQLAEINSRCFGMTNQIYEVYEGLDILADRILDDAKATEAKATEEAKKDPEPKESKQTMPLTLLQRSIMRQQNKEIFDEFVANKIRFIKEGQTTFTQLLKSFRNWFWHESTGPMCNVPTDQQVLECMYDKFGYEANGWKGIVFV